MIKKAGFMRPRAGNTRKKAGPDSFKEFDATQLYCPGCKRAVPVRKRLLLVLAEDHLVLDVQSLGLFPDHQRRDGQDSGAQGSLIARGQVVGGDGSCADE